MACSIDITIQLGDQYEGKTLFAVFKTASTTSDPITTGFADFGGGNYLWHYTEVPCDFQGAVCFFSSDAPSDIVAITSINTSDLANSESISISTGHSTQPVEVSQLDPRYAGSISITTGVTKA